MGEPDHAHHRRSDSRHACASCCREETPSGSSERCSRRGRHVRRLLPRGRRLQGQRGSPMDRVRSSWPWFSCCVPQDDLWAQELPAKPVTEDPKVAAVVAAARAEGLDISPVAFPEGTRTAADAARAESAASSVKSSSRSSSTPTPDPSCSWSPARNRLDPSLRRRAAAVPKLAKADAETVKSATGYSIGATPRFRHTTTCRCSWIADLLGYQIVWAAAGRRRRRVRGLA